VFINHRQEQWPEWLATVEFVYNNKIYSTIQTSLFKANYRQNPRMGFKERRKEKFKAAGRFVERMKKIQEETRAALGKAQEEMKKYANRRRSKGKEYKVGNLVLLSTKELKWQMKERRLEKLTEQFVEPYRVKGIISANAVELELPTIVNIHPVVNISRLQLYKLQVKGQKVVPPAPVIVEEDIKVEKILNRRKVQGKNKFLVQ